MQEKRIKRLIISILVVLILIITYNYSYAISVQYVKGDVNADDQVNNIDLLLTLRHIYSSKTNKNLEWRFNDRTLNVADINNDKNVDNVEVLMMLRYIAANKSEEIDNENPTWKESMERNSLIVQQDIVTLDLKSGETEKLIVSGENVGNVQYISLNSNIADVNDEGIITPHNVGNTAILVKASNGLEVKVKVNVVNNLIYVQNLQLDKTNINLDLNGTKTAKITATVEPANASNKNLSWTSSNPKVVSVDTNGNVTAIGVGSATITVKTLDGSNITKTCQVNVTGTAKPIYVQNLKLDKTNINLDLNGTKTAKITATVEPANASNKNLSWTSSNPKVVSVDTNGNVTAIGVGSATITVKTLDGSNISKTCQVTVIRTPIKVTAVKLNVTTREIDLTRDNHNAILVATVEPANADNQNLIWESKNPEIATVSNGVVTGLKEGKATIVVKSAENQNITATCTVNVIKGLVLSSNYNSYLDVINNTATLTATQTGSSANDTITWTVDNSNVIKLTSSSNTSVKLERVNEGTTAVHATSSSGKKATYIAGVKKEKVLFTGASCTSLMANERKDGDTGKIQNIDYGKFKKGETIFFEAYGGTGLLWYLPSSTRKTLMQESKDNYDKLLFSTKYPEKDSTGKSRYAMQDIREIINSIDKKTEHLSIAFDIEVNDIRKAENNTQATFLANTYAEFLIETAKEYPDVNFYCIPKSAYPEEASWAKHNERIRVFNTRIQKLLGQEDQQNLKYKYFYTFTKDLYEKDNKAGITSDQHPNAYTTQKMFDKILEYMKITK